MNIKLATLFSGIGAVEQALEKMGKEYVIKFSCDNGNIVLPYTFDEINSMFKKSNYININEFVESLYNKTGKINYVKKSYLANYKVENDNFIYDVRFLNAEK